MATTQKMVKIWWTAIRPKTLLAAIGPVLVGLAYSWSMLGIFHWFLALFTLLFALLMQISANLVNDYYDGIRGTDDGERLGPLRVTANKLIPPNLMRQGIWCVMGLALLMAIILVAATSWELLLVACSCLLFAYYYTAGPLPLSHLACGEILALIFFGPVPVSGTYFIQSGQWEFEAAILGLGPGAIAAGLMAINNLRDRKQDKQNHKITIANLLSEKWARYFTIAPILLAQGFMMMLTWHRPGAICFWLNNFSIFCFCSAWKRIIISPLDQQLNHTLHACGRYLLWYCLLLSCGLVT